MISCCVRVLALVHGSLCGSSVTRSTRGAQTERRPFRLRLYSNSFFFAFSLFDYSSSERSSFSPSSLDSMASMAMLPSSSSSSAARS